MTLRPVVEKKMARSGHDFYDAADEPGCASLKLQELLWERAGGCL